MHLGRMLDCLEAAGALDNTLVVVTSDNGCPFPRVKGQMYEQDFHLPLVAMWRGVSGGGRRVDDLVGFVDLAPTFLEAAGLPCHPQITGRSLVPLLASHRSGTIDPGRDRVFFGRERHDLGREHDLGYPVRCVRDREFLYVHNFAPERWPAGDPETWYTNCDGGPTKERILALHGQGNNRFYQLCFGRRPAEELYRITTDPECVENLAGRPEFVPTRERMWQELQAFLRATGDPRIVGDGEVFERYPYVGDDRHSWRAYVEGRWQKQPY
jgi:arylsulfatase A-like enzyme